jgi:hypothetical protein
MKKPTGVVIMIEAGKGGTPSEPRSGKAGEGGKDVCSHCGQPMPEAEYEDGEEEEDEELSDIAGMIAKKRAK